MARYLALKDGNIVDKKSDTTIHVTSFKVVKTRRFEIVEFELSSGATAKIARYNIDETDYNFGPSTSKEKPTKSTGKNRSQQPVPMVPVSTNGLVTFTHAELIDMYRVGKALVDLTLPKLLPSELQ